MRRRTFLELGRMDTARIDDLDATSGGKWHAFRKEWFHYIPVENFEAVKATCEADETNERVEVFQVVNDGCAGKHPFRLS